MIQLDLPSYQNLIHDAEIVEADQHGTKVLLLPDGNYVKLFRRKRLLSSALWSPYAQRFVDNCIALRARSIPCPDVIAIFRVPAIERDAVHYRPLIGDTLRQLIQRGMDETESTRLRTRIGQFVAHLHAQGIYFRSLHAGNIVLTPTGEAGLIDLADLRARRSKLGQWLRKRNLNHLMRNPQEADWITTNGTFLAAYSAARQTTA
ncbi:toluene tolerance protein [Betaproteobacteria bacterium]|nr:toluene tolerance protein [Betaproteobacteria bacterium]GHU23014.1 toluene tolerance protein [Betaproteobacteria bacterium]GHU28743.1 toluene tolerance protein [Betaproteobacteria bacterium]